MTKATATLPSVATHHGPPLVADGRRTRVRFAIIAMVFVVTTLNNADRATLSIAGSAMQSDLGFSAVTLGYLFAAFAWTYMLCQIPGGWLMDRFGSRRVYAASIFGWSLMTFLQGFVPWLGVGSLLAGLFVLRILLGVTEAPAFSGNSRLVATWFPQQERGTASAIFNSGQYAATVVFAPLMGWIVHAFGWQYVFIVMGTLGMVCAGVWLIVVHPPTRHPWIDAGELAYLREGGALVDMDDASAVAVTAGRAGSAWATIRMLLGSRMMLGVYAGQYCISVLVYFFLTWFPIYLVKGLGMPIAQAGLVAAIPAICGFTGGILGGVASDALLRRGRSTTAARKIPIVIGLTMAASVAGCAFTGDRTLAITFMALAFFGKGLGSLGWAVLSDTSPKDAAGLSCGLFNTFANLAGVTTPIVIGYIVQATGSFDWALIYVGINALLGALSFLLLVGPIRRLEPATRAPTAQA